MGLDTSYINISKSSAIGLSSLVAIAPAIRRNRTAVARGIAAIAATMLRSVAAAKAKKYPGEKY